VVTYQYLVNLYDVVLTIEADNEHDHQPITYQGEPDDIRGVRNRLSGAYGAFGHAFDPSASTPLDLDAALHKSFNPGLIERLGEAPSYDAGIPPGTLT
jgi:hypothetical protein